MTTVLIMVHLMLVLALIGVVLLQKSEGGGFVSATSGFMTGRGTANVLTRATAILAALFFATSLALSWFASFERHPSSILNTPGAPGQEAPGAPPSGQGGNLFNQLQKGLPGLPQGPGGSAPGGTPAAPAPSEPQVPQSK